MLVGENVLVFSGKPQGKAAASWGVFESQKGTPKPEVVENTRFKKMTLGQSLQHLSILSCPKDPEIKG